LIIDSKRFKTDSVAMHLHRAGGDTRQLADLHVGLAVLDEDCQIYGNYRGGKAGLPWLSPLRTGQANLSHPALQSVVNLVRTEARRDGHRKG